MERLIIVRHGETVDNIERRIQGHRDGELTPEGLRQVHALADRLAQERFDAIISSDLGRAKVTTQIVAAKHKLQPHYWPELRERNYGVYDGRLFDEYKAFERLSGNNEYTVRPERGESLSDLYERASTSLARVFDEFQGKVVLISAHGHFNCMLISVLLKKPIETWREWEQSNTCVNSFDLNEGYAVTNHVINCTAHLQNL